MTFKSHKILSRRNHTTQYWVKDTFSDKPPLNLTTTEEEQLIDISSDSSLRIKFSFLSLLGFYIKNEYSEKSYKS